MEAGILMIGELPRLCIRPLAPMWAFGSLRAIWTKGCNYGKCWRNWAHLFRCQEHKTGQKMTCRCQPLCGWQTNIRQISCLQSTVTPEAEQPTMCCSYMPVKT